MAIPELRQNFIEQRILMSAMKNHAFAKSHFEVSKIISFLKFVQLFVLS